MQVAPRINSAFLHDRTFKSPRLALLQLSNTCIRLFQQPKLYGGSTSRLVTAPTRKGLDIKPFFYHPSATSIRASYASKSNTERYLPFYFKEVAAVVYA